MVAFALSLTLFPAPAHAGFFSFISNLLKQEKAEAEAEVEAVISIPETKINSQKLKILEAPIAANPAVGGGNVVIVDETALISQDNFADTDIVQPNNGQISVYVVRPGDTLSQIAKMYEVSVNTIIWANNIRGSTISEGQTLIILPVSGIRHIVKSGETVLTIAKKYKADEKEILSFNNIEDGAKLAVGTEIIVPDATVSTPASSSGSSGVTSAPRGTRNLPSYEDYYIKPVPNGRRTQGIHGYNGIDFGAPVGTPILAAAAGKVIISRSGGYNGGYGSYIVLYHPNGTQTLYAHLSKNAVSQGAEVSKGQVIGYVGMTGKVTGPHLHFEVRGAKNPF